MSSSGGTADAGEASSSTAALISSGPSVKLPEDALAVEWWLARRAIEGDGGVPFVEDGSHAVSFPIAVPCFPASVRGCLGR